MCFCIISSFPFAVYIAIDESGLVNLQLVLRGAYARKFDIHLQQIECGSPLMGKENTV